MEKALRIGEVAGRAGVNVQTLRFYERRGLLPEPPRRASGYREYAPESVRRVRFIKRAQELGFTLAEVEELLRLREDPRIPAGRCVRPRKRRSPTSRKRCGACGRCGPRSPPWSNPAPRIASTTARCWRRSTNRPSDRELAARNHPDRTMRNHDDANA